MPRFRRERRTRAHQRAAVEDILERAQGVATVMRSDDGSVWVYDEIRDRETRGTRRFRVTADGDVDPPDFFRFRGDGS